MQVYIAQVSCLRKTQQPAALLYRAWPLLTVDAQVLNTANPLAQGAIRSISYHFWQFLRNLIGYQ